MKWHGTFCTDVPPPCTACGMQGAIYDVRMEQSVFDWLVDVVVGVKCSCCHARSTFSFREELSYDPSAADLRRHHELALRPGGAT
jgi:hypothetical protein